MGWAGEKKLFGKVVALLLCLLHSSAQKRRRINGPWLLYSSSVAVRRREFTALLSSSFLFLIQSRDVSKQFPPLSSAPSPSPPPPFSPPLSFKSCWLRWNNFQACWPEKRRKRRRRLSRKTRKNARGGEKGCREYPDPTAQHNDMFTP